MKVLFLYAIVFSVVSGISQSAYSQNSELEVLIEKISGRIELPEIVEGFFLQDKFINVLPRPLKSRGEFSYSHDEGLDWITKSPIESRLMFDDQGIRQEMDGKLLWQIEAEQPAVATITRVIVSVLALDWEALQDYFFVEGSYDQGQWQLKLIPKEQVLLQIVESLSVSGNRQLEKLILFEANQDRTEIAFTFSDLATN